MPRRRALPAMPALPRLFLLSLLSLLFLLPPLYLHLDASSWKARLRAAAHRPSALASAHALVVSGLSLPSSSSPSHPIPPAPPAVAVCITGHLRSFARPSVRLSIRRHLLHPLRASGADVDLFFHVARPPSALPSLRKPALRRPSPTRARRAARAMRAFAPAHVSFFRGPGPALPAPKCRSPSLRRPPTHYPPALLRAHECLRHVARFEAATGRRYDWLYKTRPDVAFAAPVSLPRDLRTDTFYMNMHNPGTSTHAHPWLRRQFQPNASVLGPPVGDHVLIAARDVADVALSAVHAFDECTLYTLPNGTLNSEVALTYWLVRNRVRYTVKDWFWMLVRDDTGPECFRVRWIRNVTHQHDETLSNKCRQYKASDELPE